MLVVAPHFWEHTLAARRPATAIHSAAACLAPRFLCHQLWTPARPALPTCCSAPAPAASHALHAAQMSEPQLEDVARWCNRYPDISVSYEVRPCFYGSSCFVADRNAVHIGVSWWHGSWQAANHFCSIHASTRTVSH